MINQNQIRMNTLNYIEIKNRQKRQFDILEKEYLGGYVYGLKDPRDNKIFYVGQADLNDHNNGRLFDHFEEAEAFVNGTRKASSKILRIVDIWNSSLDVEWVIFACKLTNKRELNIVEASIIDAFSESQNGLVLNDQLGPNSTLLTEDGLKSIAAKPINPIIAFPRVFVFSIQNTIATNGVYEATRKAWVIKKEHQTTNDTYAVGLVNYVSKGAFKVNKWEKSSENRVEFIKDHFKSEEELELKEKNWLQIINGAKGYWQRGNFLIIEFDGNKKFRYVRGSSNIGWNELL